MTIRGAIEANNDFEGSLSGTLCWTLSLYLEPDNVSVALGLNSGDRIEPDIFRRTQLKHLPSFALRNAIDPLMNDIADRETQGQIQEFLLAATDANPASLKEAAAEVRHHKEVVFRLPASIAWTTEGVDCRAHPPHLDDQRLMRLRRFWFAHNNGALSYHVAFSHFYGSYTDERGQKRSGYDPSTFYFLSLLQKLVAPKEFSLNDAILSKLRNNPAKHVTVFDNDKLGIEPLDLISVEDGERTERFWPFIRRYFEDDAKALFHRVADEMVPPGKLQKGFETRLLDFIPFTEVPGLDVPKSRFMFMFHDKRFFDRLMPLDLETGETAARKLVVQEQSYLPYQKRLMDLTKAAGDGVVHLDKPYWDWVASLDDTENSGREPEQAQISSATFADSGAADSGAFGDTLVAQQEKRVEQSHERIPDTRPAFADQSGACMDYLFLAGFNQNIIDFLNQDTSEILDSIDPIYPDSKEQADERFFVRYANHRAIITYVPQSRSLETGNDYIGTCPYAFLIHVLALHNEFLARRHEQMSLARIDRIQALVRNEKIDASNSEVAALNRRERLGRGDPFDLAEIAINDAKLAEFREFERFRYDNPFRYDTERDVFAKLEELRGVKRKTNALALAIASLEDHAQDLKRRHKAHADKMDAKRATRLNILLGGTGVFGAGQMFYWIGETANGGDDGAAAKSPIVFDLGWTGIWDRVTITGRQILETTTDLMFVALCIFAPLLIWIILDELIGRPLRVAMGRTEGGLLSLVFRRRQGRKQAGAEAAD